MKKIIIIGAVCFGGVVLCIAVIRIYKQEFPGKAVWLIEEDGKFRTIDKEPDVDYEDIRDMMTWRNRQRCLNIEIVLIPEGSFSMGSPGSEENRIGKERQGEIDEDEIEILHEVNLSSFRMMKYEVTNKQFARFLNDKNVGQDGIDPESRKVLILPDGPEWGLSFKGFGIRRPPGELLGRKWVHKRTYEDHPVVRVTWDGAAEFAEYVGGHLPTEAQWEYACRAGTVTPFNTGYCLDNYQAIYLWSDPYFNCTNTIDIDPVETKRVGTYPPNAWGLYDMHGNVWEWCNDWLGPYPTKVQDNPTGPESGEYHVVRGGSWKSRAHYCRSARRNPPHPRSNAFGLRLVFLE